jgi:hypothetical protein
MFVSIDQIAQSLGRLEQIHPFFGMSFLIFARENVPVGKTKEIVLARLAAELLEKHYKASVGYDGYYNPFLPSGAKSRWIKKNYNHTTLQRITADTFGDVTIHPKGTSEWGWQKTYVEGLRAHLSGVKIPAFDLAVWLFRDIDFPANVQPADLIDRLRTEFGLEHFVLFHQLFDETVPALADPWVTNSPITERQLLRVIGFPPGAAPEEGAALHYLELRGVGPASHLDYEPATRLNIITGDNSLGKTFLLECIWWALTGEWLDRPAYPRVKAMTPRPSIAFSIQAAEGETQSHKSQIDRKTGAWTAPPSRKVLAGLVIYARYDGSFAIWDPAKVALSDRFAAGIKHSILLDTTQLWHGLTDITSTGEPRRLCNGLLQDWVLWQLGGTRYQDQFRMLATCLDRLSPSDNERLIPGNPIRFNPLDTRETPTLKMAYGETPIQLASAGVQRIVAVAYVLVWAWFEHLESSSAIRKNPQRRLVFLIDEAEAHLHPKWQRLIVPALTDVINLLSAEITPQVHLATHSPMVMASTEAIFDESVDDLHHLRLVEGDVELQELPFVKRGTVDQWLLSDVFELCQARSVPAEQAIEHAKRLQMSEAPDAAEVLSVNARLEQALAPDDDFWPRWRFFARKYGVR